MTKRPFEFSNDYISIGWLDKLYKEYKIASIIENGKISYREDELIKLKGNI